MFNMKHNNWWWLCSERDEPIDQIVSEWNKLAQKGVHNYERLSWKDDPLGMLQEIGFWTYKVKSVLENETYKILGDFEIETYFIVTSRRSDLILF